jgi:hypothetical protein
MVKVMKSFAILTISKLWSCLRWTIASPAYFGRKIFEALLMLATPPPPPPRRQHFQETFLLLGQHSRKCWSKHDDTKCRCLHDVPEWPFINLAQYFINDKPPLSIGNSSYRLNFDVGKKNKIHHPAQLERAC